MDVGAYGLQTAIVVMHLSRTGINSNELSIIMAIQVLLLWIKVQYYARYPPRNASRDCMLLLLTVSCTPYTAYSKLQASAARHAADEA